MFQMIQFDEIVPIQFSSVQFKLWITFKHKRDQLVVDFSLRWKVKVLVWTFFCKTKRFASTVDFWIDQIHFYEVLHKSYLSFFVQIQFGSSLRESCGRWFLCWEKFRHVGIVKDCTDTVARVELHANCQTITVDRCRVSAQFNGPNKPVSAYGLARDGSTDDMRRRYGDSSASDVNAGLDMGTRTPRYQDLTKTPAYDSGRTPAYENVGCTPRYSDLGKTPNYSQQTPGHSAFDGDYGAVSRTPGAGSAWDADDSLTGLIIYSPSILPWEWPSYNLKKSFCTIRIFGFVCLQNQIWGVALQDISFSPRPFTIWPPKTLLTWSTPPRWHPVTSPVLKVRSWTRSCFAPVNRVEPLLL